MAKVAEAVGAVWRVTPDQVRLEWGLLPPTPIDPTASVRLTGTGANGWYVVVVTGGTRVAAIRVHAGVDDSVPVAATMLTAGHILVADDMRRELRVRFGTPDSTTVRPAAGWVVRRTVAEGSLLAPPQVTPPTLVRLGQTVRFLWRQGGVEVEMSATALQDGGLGEVIRARGPAREALLGRVTAPGEVTIERGVK